MLVQVFQRADIVLARQDRVSYDELRVAIFLSARPLEPHRKGVQSVLTLFGEQADNEARIEAA